MEYRNLGSSGLLVSRVAFGGSHVGESLDQAATTAIVDRAIDLGVTAFYTADAYAAGQAEVILGNAIRRRRDDLVLMVKAGYRVGDPGPDEIAAPITGVSLDHDGFSRRGITPTSRGLSRKHLLQAIDASLTRLNTDFIDVYQIHYWDQTTPVEETIDVLTGLVRSGKVRYIGCSQTTAWQLYRGLWVSEVRGLQRFESIQVRYNVFERRSQADLLAAAAAAGVSVLAYSSLAGTLLSNEANLSAKPDGLASRQRYADLYWTQSNVALAQRLRGVAANLGRTIAEVAQGWALAQPAVTSILVGPSTPDQLTDELASVEKPLDLSELAVVDAVLDADSPQ